MLGKGGGNFNLRAIQDALAPLIEKANECVDQDLIFDTKTDTTDGFYSWKDIMLLLIILKNIYDGIGDWHQRRILKDEQRNISMYHSLIPTNVKEFISLEKCLKSRQYNIGIYGFNVGFQLLDFIFEFSVILFDIFPFLWYGWIAFG